MHLKLRLKKYINKKLVGVRRNIFKTRSHSLAPACYGNSPPAMIYDEYGELACCRGIRARGSSIVVKRECDDNGEQLNDACWDGNFPSVRSLVNSGTSVDYQDNDGWTPAIHCIYWNKYRDGRNSEILQFLLEQGANAELSSNDGWTPLIYAAYHNSYEIATMLIRHGVVLDAVNKYGTTALGEASANGYLQIVKLLVQSGADLDIADDDGETPISIAECFDNIDVVAYLTIERNWRRRRNYASVLNSLKGTPTISTITRVFQCYDLARVIGTYL